MATINLSDEDYERLKKAAEERGRTPAELVSAYVHTLILPGEELSPLGRSFMDRIDRLIAEGKIPDADPNLDEGDWVDEALAKDYYAHYRKRARKPLGFSQGMNGPAGLRSVWSFGRLWAWTIPMGMS